MKAQVSPLMLEELETRAECLEEEEPEAAASVRAALDDVHKGRRPTGMALEAVKEEMGVLESFDRFASGPESRQWYEAAAFLGILTAFDPKVTYAGRRPKKITIDGTAYEDWR